MNSWNCCRLCLSESNLNPIFSLPDHIEKYTEIIFNTTGVMVDPKDLLPQKMCSECIQHINEINKFRRDCLSSQETLMQQSFSLKTNSDNDKQVLKRENFAEIDIKEYKSQKCEELDDFTNNYDMVEVDKGENETHTDKQDLDLDDKPLKYLLGKTKRKCTEKKIKEKKETKRVKKPKERVREEINCELCPKVLTSKLSLRNHYKIHTGFDVVCEHCGKRFITKRLLLMHCRARHGYEKTDKCSYCDYTASNAEQVKIHERLHTGERPFVCSRCGAGFHRNSSYLQHVAIHLPEKTVQCDQCPARFKSVTLMRIHRHRHRPPAYTFKCYICASSFARRRNVLRHLSRIHSVTEPSQNVERIKIV